MVELWALAAVSALDRASGSWPVGRDCPGSLPAGDDHHRSEPGSRLGPEACMTPAGTARRVGRLVTRSHADPAGVLRLPRSRRTPCEHGRSTNMTLLLQMGLGGVAPEE